MKTSTGNVEGVEIFGKNIEYLRKRENKNLQEFGRDIHYDRNCLAELEGGFHNIRLSTVVRIAEILDKDVGMLFSRSFISDPKYCQSKSFTKDNYRDIFIKNAMAAIKSQQVKMAKISAERREIVSRVLNGHVADPMVGTLGRIASAINVPMSELLTDTTKEG